MKNLDFCHGHGRNFGHLTIVISKFWPWSWSKIFDHMTMTPARRPYGQKIMVALPPPLNFSRSGSNLICKPGKSKSAKITRIRRNFINERVMLSWNKLPSDVKNSESLDIFKSNLELFKSKTRALGISGCGNYWELSDEVLDRIEAGSYLENKMRHNEYLKDNPLAAKKKFINLH